MTTNINLIISLILIILIIIHNIITIKKNKNIYKGPLYKKINKINLFLSFISIFIFIIATLLNLGNNILTILLNALSISIISFPIYLSTSYYSFFTDEEKLSHIKTIVTDIYDEKIIKKFNKEGINVIILSPKTIKTKIKTILESEISKKQLKNNLIIKTDNKKVLDNIIDKRHTFYSFNELDNIYSLINKARGQNDNYVRTIKYLINTNLPLILSYLFLSIVGFPITHNILVTIILKFLTIITCDLVYKKMPYDIDIITREPKEDNIIMGSQETFFTIITSFIISFVITIPYMVILSQGGSESFANTLFLITYIFSNLFITLSLVSESSLLKNFIKSLTNIRIIIYIISCIALTIILNFTKYFNTRNIELHNFISCLTFSLISVFFYEITKLARYTKVRGGIKHEHKNN